MYRTLKMNGKIILSTSNQKW